MASPIAQHVERLRLIFASRGFSLPLARPITRAQIEALEAETGIALDGGLREFYALTNGSVGNSWLAITSDELTPCELFSLAECAQAWRQWLPYEEATLLAEWGPPEAGRDGRIRPEFFVRCGWLPIGEFNGGSTTLFFDADPATSGTRGQIIVYQHDPEAVFWCARSFAEMFEQSNALMEQHFDELMLVDGEPAFHAPPPL